LAETDLSREAMKVLLSMRGSLQYENIVGRSQADVAKRLMMPQPNVSKAVKELIKHGILEELPQVGRKKQYRMSHFVGWRGSMKSEREFLAGETARL
jgi:DNA-binding MarR family transcriptional regulator